MKNYWRRKYFSNGHNNGSIYALPENTQNHLIRYIINNKPKFIYIYSLHSTFASDIKLAKYIKNKLGIPVIGTSYRDYKILGNKLELRKVYSKSVIFPQYFDKIALPIFKKQMGENWIVKRSDMTKGFGQKLIKKKDIANIKLGNQMYIERFIHGQEYSVNIVNSKCNGLVVLPAINKGMTTYELIHPCKKKRSIADLKIGKTLMELTKELVELMSPSHVAEFEFIVTDDEEIYLIEVNPRVSGTFKIAMDHANLTLDKIR